MRTAWILPMLRSGGRMGGPSVALYVDGQLTQISMGGWLASIMEQCN